MSAPHAVDAGRAADVGRVRLLGWWAVVEYRVCILRAFLPSILMIAVGSPILYLLGLGAGLGVLVDGGKGIAGVDYLTFVAPALVMATAMQASAQENTFGVFGGFKWSNAFTSMRLTPVSPAQMAIGFQVSVLARVVPVMGFYILALWIFRIGDPLGALVLVPIGALLSLAAGFAVMAWVSTQKDDRGQLSFIDRFVIVPLTLFSGTYFPLETLPGYLQPIGWISPLWHASELGRGALYGAPIGAMMTAVHLGFLVALAAVGCWLSVRTFRRRLDD